MVDMIRASPDYNRFDITFNEAVALIHAHVANETAALTAKVERMREALKSANAKLEDCDHAGAAEVLRAALADEEVEKTCATCGLDCMTADNAHSCDSIYACNAYDHWQPMDETKTCKHRKQELSRCSACNSSYSLYEKEGALTPLEIELGEALEDIDRAMEEYSSVQFAPDSKIKQALAHYREAKGEGIEK
jgi:NDP-sugar pyrophosphorylase family protein